MAQTACNVPLDQDRARDTFEHFDRFGDVMFHQQRAIYNRIAERLKPTDSVVEAGCGSGSGTAILQHWSGASIIGTDKLQRNVDFANALYPWITFGTWDMETHPPFRADVVVCVEALEHVGNGEGAVKNLLAAARREVWISTPNGYGKRNPPENPYHVREYCPGEILEMIGKSGVVTILDWRTFAALPETTNVNPIVYHVHK